MDKILSLNGTLIRLPDGIIGSNNLPAIFANLGFGGVARSVFVDTTENIYVGGAFPSYDGEEVNGMTYLNQDGTINPAFSAGTGFDNTIWRIRLANNKLYVGGQFTEYQDTSTNVGVVLSLDGTLEVNLKPFDGFTNSPYYIEPFSDGKFLVFGNFTGYDGSAFISITKFDEDGSINQDWANSTSGSGGLVRDVTITNDSSILAVGSFFSWDSNSVPRMAKLNKNGEVDTVFNSNLGSGANNQIYSVWEAADGSILVGGNFTLWNGTSANGIVRLNAEGIKDTTFSPPSKSGDVYWVRDVAGGNGKVIAGGSFSDWGGPAGRIVQFNSNGSRDEAFMANTNGGFDSTAYDIAVASDKYYITFNGSSYGGVSSPYLVAVKLNGKIDG